MNLASFSKGPEGSKLPVTLALLGALCLVSIVCLYPVILATISFLAQVSLFILNGIAALLAHRGDAGIPVAIEAQSEGLVFSVHVPTHDEPPHLVIATLAALRAQKNAPPYEVIVIDNNTRDPAVWLPVEHWCRENPLFRFLHREGVVGAKAGALNIALAQSRPDATHIVTVDADYQVQPDFLTVAAAEIAARRVDFVQFPQAYRCCDAAGAGIALELSDYFDRHARAANRADAMLLTGTLSVIRKEALLQVGGWSARTATEDAELGLRLGEAGFRGAFARQVVGRGLLPLTLNALHRQRFRWASGNMRTLLLWLSGRTTGAARPRLARQVLAATQLTAWVNFALPAALALLISAVQMAAHVPAGAQGAAIAFATLLLVMASAAIPLIVAGNGSMAHVATAVSTRIALLPTAAAATVAGMFPGVQVFRVTPKAICGAPGKADPPVAMIVASVCGVGLVAAGLAMGSLPLTGGGVLLLLPLLAAGLTARALAGYASVLRMREV